VLDVKTLTRPPQTPVRPRAVAEAPRRWHRRLAAIGVLVVLVAAAVASIWIVNLEPVSTGPVGFAIAGHGLHVTHRDVDALGVQGSIQTVPMQRDMTFRYRFSITNTGPVPITIVDVGSQDPQQISTKLVAAKPALLAAPGPAEGFGPFAPFRLGPGEVAGLTMQVHVAPDVCYMQGSFAAWYEEPMTFRVLGITRHTVVNTGTEIRLEGTDATAC
jgi:hypothetical protein